MMFIFAVLGSVVFWIFYFVISFILGSITMKFVAPRTFAYVTGGEKRYIDGVEELIFVAIVVMLFWHIIAFVWIVLFILKNFFTKLVGPICKQGITAAASLVPDIEIKK